MYTVTYYKFGGRWFLDLPEYLDNGGNEEDLERIGGFHEFLDWVSEGAGSAVFQMSAEPFDGADFFELVSTSGGNSGGYYRLLSYKGQPIEIELWFNTILYLTQKELPQKIYFKMVV